jgi:hypothetical protein
MKWCCAAFQGRFEEAGLRGLAVFAATSAGEPPLFILQFRATDSGTVFSDSSGPLSLLSDAVINFCPWCGVRLKDWYRQFLKELDRSDLRIQLDKTKGESLN